FHQLQRRIEAHICISFVAYKVYKELERRLYEMKADITPNKVIEIAENIYQIKAKIPNSNKTIKKILLLTEEQKYLAKLFGF
ncbi:MAG: transposase, partial [Candidatus Delongbacteria bacterium]